MPGKICQRKESKNLNPRHDVSPQGFTRSRVSSNLSPLRSACDFYGQRVDLMDHHSTTRAGSFSRDRGATEKLPSPRRVANSLVKSFVKIETARIASSPRRINDYFAIRDRSRCNVANLPWTACRYTMGWLVQPLCSTWRSAWRSAFEFRGPIGSSVVISRSFIVAFIAAFLTVVTSKYQCVMSDDIPWNPTRYPWQRQRMLFRRTERLCWDILKFDFRMGAVYTWKAWKWHRERDNIPRPP